MPLRSDQIAELIRQSGQPDAPKWGKRHPDGRNLYLVTRRGRGFWVTQYWDPGKVGKVGSKGLGSFPAVTLAAARKAREEFVVGRRNGVTTRSSVLATTQRTTNGKTFKEAAAAYLEARANDWSPKERARQGSLLRLYAATLDDRPVVAITTEEIADMLRPNWRGPGTNAVSKTRALIEQVLNTVDNPAASWSRLRTRNLARKAPETKNMASLPYAQVPGLMIELRRSQHPAARLLQFLILTGVRLDEAREAQWSEIKGDLWTIAAGRMKKRIEHVGPLSPQALAVLGERGEGPVFGIGATAVWECLKSFNRVDKHGDQITTHGFRSSMATWAEENRWAPNVIEAALAHRKGDKTKAAYQRSPLLEERRKLADAWADFATG